MAGGGAMSEAPWSEPLRLSALAHGAIERRLEPDEAARGRIARELGLDALESLQAELTVAPWLDGAEITGRWRARVRQTCGVTLEPLESDLEGDLFVRALPAGSRHAPKQASAEIAVDPDGEDPPDLLETEAVDLGAYVVEHLSLEIDPFPRKPGAVFEQPDKAEPPSPFAVLKVLKTGPQDG